jgi:alkylated DNA repair dioxygenase AlkB
MEVITLTIGDCAENHIHNQQLGQTLPAGQGFQRADFEAIQQKIEPTELVTLSSSNDQEDACVLIIRNGVNKLLGDGGAKTMYEEQTKLDWDKKVKMYGRVVNKHARHNLCYDTESQEPNYEEGKGRIIALKDVPKLQEIITKLKELVGPKFENLKVEGNRYYSENCGIGYHGDTERVRVCGIRLGTYGIPIHYQWFKDGNPVGDRITIPLNPGDIYFMNEKAVGTDWKKKKIATLRHAVGADKYTKI